MDLIWTILVGLLVGALARFIMPGRQSMGWIMTLVLGLAGAFVATFLGRTLGWYGEGSAAGIIGSVVGALILLFAYSQFQKSGA